MQRKNVVNNKCHTRGILSGISTNLSLQKATTDPRQKHSGMTTFLYNGNGFTLIELLVVVLIIGILAAVALPQYQKTVLKSRVIGAMVACDALFQASERYRLANGSWPISLEELDVDMPGNLTQSTQIRGNGFTCSLFRADSPSASGAVMCNVPEKGVGIRRFFTNPDKRYCYAETSISLAHSVCQNMSNRKEPSHVSGSFSYYLLP